MEKGKEDLSTQRELSLYRLRRRLCLASSYSAPLAPHFANNFADLSAKAHIATHIQILYTSAVEYPFPPVGIVGAADGKNRRAFLFLAIILLCFLSTKA